MDIQHLVDRLEDLIDEGRHVPLSKLTLIDEERALEIIDQMRISVPEEIDKATRVISQRDRLMAQANEEAARIVQLAKEKGETLVQRDSVVQAAQNRAANIIEQARQDAEAIRAEADNYVVEVLNELEGQLLKTLTVVRNGINKIQQDREASRARVEAALQQANQQITASSSPRLTLPQAAQPVTPPQAMQSVPTAPAVPPMASSAAPTPAAPPQSAPKPAPVEVDVTADSID